MNSKYLFLLIFARCLYAHGSSWEYIGPDTVAFTAIHNWGNGTIIAAPFEGRVKPFNITYDFGKTWDTLSTPTWTMNMAVDQFLLHKNVLYIIRSSSFSSSKNDLYTQTNDVYNFGYSLDSAKSWQSFDKFNETRAWWIFGKDSLLLVGCDGHVARSTDSGKTWQRHTVGAAQCYSIAKYNDTLYCGTNSGLYVSHNWGESWAFRGADVACIYTLHFVGNILITGVQIGVRYHRNFGFGNSTTWTTTIGPEVGLISNAYPVKDSIVYAHYAASAGVGITGSHMYYSTDSAKTFNRFWFKNDSVITPRVIRFYSDSIYAYALTYKGIYRRLIYDETQNAHKSFSLKQKTTPVCVLNNGVKIITSPGSTVVISLYTLNGRLVNTPYSGVQNRDIDSYPLYQQGVAFGIYMVVANVNSAYPFCEPIFHKNNF